MVLLIFWCTTFPDIYRQYHYKGEQKQPTQILTDEPSRSILSVGSVTATRYVLYPTVGYLQIAAKSRYHKFSTYLTEIDQAKERCHSRGPVTEKSAYDRWAMAKTLNHPLFSCSGSGHFRFKVIFMRLCVKDYLTTLFIIQFKL